QGRSSTKDLLMGSVSRHVLSESDCDVLISTACGSHESVM
ncbi:MAG: universal stress protein, partial [Caldimonas sp.]